MFRIASSAVVAALLTAASLPSITAETEEKADCTQLSQLKAKAENENSAAQYQLGWDYFRGKCVSLDYAEAQKWLKLSAAAGYVKAEAPLGFIYHKQGDDTRAMQWTRKAAGHGDPVGESSLAWMYYLGKGTEKDYGEAAKWAQLSAAQGIGGAQLLLGMLYQIGGGGLPKDSVQADMWFSLSDKSDSEHQNTNVRQRLEESMSQKDIVEAQRRAVLWKPKPAAE